MNEYFADLHIHLGRDGRGRAVKVSASPTLTVQGVVDECSLRKGVSVAGIVDSHSPGVLEDLERLASSDVAAELPGGGIRVQPGGEGEPVTILLCSEVEVEVRGSRCHLLCYIPGIREMREFSKWLEPRVTNVQLSSQLCGAPAAEVVRAASGLGGFVVPAHAFTPHRGLLGACVSRLEDAFEPDDLAALPAIELGLSADADMADTIEGMERLAFLSNSDAHSRGVIAREYNALRLESPSFDEVRMAMSCAEGRAIVANYGLDPRLGKYHRTFCPACGHAAEGQAPATSCRRCGNERVVTGVWDRVKSISAKAGPVRPARRPPYVRQVPLSFIPGVGPRTLDRLIRAFGSEMNVLHRARADELERVIGSALASRVLAAREGRLNLRPGAGGEYGSVILDSG